MVDRVSPNDNNENANAPKLMVGFRCSPELKLQLTKTTQDCYFSLSEYCELILSSYEETADKITELESLVGFYENDKLKRLFSKLKGQQIDFTSADGYPMSVKVNSVKDVFTILVNSFSND